MSGRIWIDVEDLFEYVRENQRPSGIQRIEFELCRSFASLPETREKVRFVRHSSVYHSFDVISYHQIEMLYTRITATIGHGEHQIARAQGDPASAERERPSTWRAAAEEVIKRAVYRLPDTVRIPLTRLLIHQRAALQAFAAVMRAVFAVVTATILRKTASALDVRPAATTGSASPEHGPIERDHVFDRDAGPGDVLLVLGSPWFHPAYAAIVSKAQRKYGLRFATLVYDIIPLRRPEWCDKGLIRLFDAWFRSVLPLVDTLLTISQATASDLERFAFETGMNLRSRPQLIPIGAGFATPPTLRVGNPANPLLSRGGSERGLPTPGSYALIVSTIEARKNHVLLFRVWRRLLAELPLDKVPILVFAGRVGWLVADLIEQLRNASYLGGKIVLIRDPTDSELVALYQGCLFTLFPSFYEGWGLPVTESLAFGRPCIISDATSLPEAGGSLARYFDPHDGAAAYRVIRDTIIDPEGLVEWQKTITREFVPTTWDQSAKAIHTALAVAGTVKLSLAMSG